MTDNEELLANAQEELETTNNSNPGTFVFLVALAFFFVGIFAQALVWWIPAGILAFVARTMWAGRLLKIRRLQKEINRLDD